jgi:hypothetical protein
MCAWRCLAPCLFLHMLPVRSIDFSFLSDKELLTATRFGEGGVWATGPFACDTVVSRRCASLGARFSSSACGEALPEGAAGLPEGGVSVVHKDTYNRTFLFFACADVSLAGGGAPPAAAALAARGSVLARVGAASRGGGALGKRPRSVWAEAAPRSGWAVSEAAVPALPEELASPCRAERATRVVCAQTEPRQGEGSAAGGPGASAPWGTRCSCMQQHRCTTPRPYSGVPDAGVCDMSAPSSQNM